MQNDLEQREIDTDDSSTMDELENEFDERDLKRVEGCYSLALLLVITFVILAIKAIQYCL